MYTRRLLLPAAQVWLGLAAPPPGAAGVQAIEQPGAAATSAAATSAAATFYSTSVEDVPADTATATSATPSAVPSQSSIIMPPQMNICQEQKNAWAGFTIQQRSPVHHKVPNLEPQPMENLLEKRRYREAPPRVLCYKVGEFDFFNYDKDKGNTQTVTLRKNLKYTVIVYASATVTGIKTFTKPPGSGWQTILPAKTNAQLVSYDTWVPLDGDAHFQITFDTEELPVHGKVVLYQLPIAPSGPEG